GRGVCGGGGGGGGGGGVGGGGPVGRAAVVGRVGGTCRAALRGPLACREAGTGRPQRGGLYGRHDPEGELLLHHRVRQAGRGGPALGGAEEGGGQPDGGACVPERAQDASGFRPVGRCGVHRRREGRKDQAVQAQDGVPHRGGGPHRRPRRRVGEARRGEDQRHRQQRSVRRDGPLWSDLLGEAAGRHQ